MKFHHYLFLTSGLAMAQPRSLEPLVVEAARGPAPTTVPTVAESRAEIARVPGGAEVIEAERFLTGRASTLADTFALSPGVIAQPRFGSDEARLSIRGSGIQRTFHGRGIRMLQDGIPLNLADGGFDMQAIDPLAVSHLEVLRGANALAAGASTLGGAIDHHSATGLTSPGGSLRLEGGSFDYLRARVQAGGTRGEADAFAAFSHTTQAGFREHARQDAQRFFGNAGWRPADDVEMRLFLTAVRSRSELPGSLTKSELESDPAQADGSPFGAAAYDNRRDYDLFRVAEKTTVTRGADTWEFTVAYSHKDLDHPITPFVGVIDQLSHDVLLGGVFTRDGALGGRENRLRLGAFQTWGRTGSATFQNIFGSRGALTAKAEQTAMNVEGFLENQLDLGAGITGVLGGTASWNRRENKRLAGAVAPYDRIYRDLSPMAGIIWTAGDWQIFGNVSGSYEPPTFSETNSAAAANRAQTATTVELGTRGAHAFFRWDATAYAAEVDGEFLALNDATGTPLGTTNADRTLHQGLELFAEADLLGAPLTATPDHRLFLRGALTYGRFRFDDDATYGDNTLAGLPPVLIRGEWLWENRAGYYAGPTLEWVPVKSWVDHANTLSADPYALPGFKIGRRVADGVSWFLEARNLTDERHAATTGVVADAGADPRNTSRNFLPGDGRAVFAGVEWKW